MARYEGPIRKLTSLARKVAIWAWISVALQIGVSLFSCIEAVELTKRPWRQSLGAFDTVIGDGLDLLAGMIALAMIVAFVVSAILGLRWIYLANANAHRLAQGLTISPGWNVGWFFIPIANLFQPFVGVEQVWRASTDPEHWAKIEIPGFLRSWWGLWLAADICASISARLDLMAQTVGGRLLSDIADVLSTAFIVPATVLFLRIVREVTSTQDSKAAES